MFSTASACLSVSNSFGRISTNFLEGCSGLASRFSDRNRVIVGLGLQLTWWKFEPSEHFLLLMKKALRDMQTLHAGCSKVEPNIFTRRRPPSRGVWDGQNLINWRWSLLSPTDPVW